MLKVIAFENFVHFKDKEVINFESAKRIKKAPKGISDAEKKTPKGISANTEETANEVPNNKEDATKGTSEDTETKNKLNFFVGANFCGKSTVLELLRRCMTTEINVSETSSFNKEKLAYVFCKFDLDSKEVISGVIKEKNTCATYRFHKILIYPDESGKILRCNSFESSDSTPTESFRRFVEPEDKDLFEKKGKDSKYVEYIHTEINSQENIIKGRKDGTDWKKLEEAYVATMPLRGIGTVQWTKSKKIKPKDKDKDEDEDKDKYHDHYKDACERAEIISDLLSPGLNVVNENYVDANKEKKFFGHLTYPQTFSFEKTDETSVKHGSSDSFPLLKTSEGILEAKQVSLLLAHKEFQTICLEEPDRGMHAQMIDRLRALLYQEGWKKTIIVSTHSRYFIDTSTINNTHVFFRTEEIAKGKQKTNDKNKNYSCKVRNVGLQKELSKVSDVETLRNLLFSTKVLLVEGPTDKDVVQALFTQLREIRQEEICEKEKPDITTYQIIPIGGCQSATNVLKFCKYINLPALCLLDDDEVVKKNRSPRETIFQWVITRVKEMVDWFKQKYACRTESVSLVDDCRTESDSLVDDETKEKIYTWSCGALEDAILSSENKGIADLLKISLKDTTTRSKKLKSKLKQRLDEEDRRSFSMYLLQVDEINRFLDFMRKEEKKRIEDSPP